VKKIVDTPGPDSGPVWSPDGKWIAFRSAMGNPKFFHANARIAVVSAEGGAVRSVSDAFDEQPSIVDWRAEGIYFTGMQRTQAQVFRADVASGKITRISMGPAGSDFTMTKDGRMAALTIATAEHVGEIFVTELGKWAPRKLTDLSAQVKDWTLPTSEVISWKSRDGAEIEGVLTRRGSTRRRSIRCCA
jgi:Tol biopolymer transport system component